MPGQRRTRHPRQWASTVSSVTRDRAELGAFLRTRRDRLSPAQAGVEPFPGARRVPGLRRDELAYLAGLSPDYYARVEQGRQANVSAEVLQGLGRALRLDEVEQAHLADLASPVSTGRAATQAPVRADPGLLRVLAQLEAVPALLLDYRGDVLARNSLLAAVLGRPLMPGASFMRFLFLDPLARERIINWEVFAQTGVAGLRRESGRRPGDPALTRLIDDLRAADEDVARWWADQSVRDHASVTKRIRHPTAGDLAFGIEAVSATLEPDQRLVVYTVEPDSATARVLPLVASWADREPEAASG